MTRHLTKFIPGKSVFLKIAKMIVYLLAVAVFAGSVVSVFYSDGVDSLKEFVKLREIGPEDPLPEAKRLYSDQKYCEALEYLDYYMDYEEVKNNPEVQELYTKIGVDRMHWWTITGNIVYGVWAGKGPCLENIVSATVSDFFVVGDLRDFAWEGTKIIQGQSPDKFTMALSAAGMALAVSTWFSSGSSAPVKGSVSILKLAKKSNKLKPTFQSSLTDLLYDSVKTTSWKPFDSVAGSIYKLREVKGLKIGDSMNLLSACKSVKDLDLVVEMASVCGNKTGKFLFLGGDRALDVFRKFRGQKQMENALDLALRYGKNGTTLLEKTGPDKFLKYAAVAKLLVRGTRSWHQGRLSYLASALASSTFWLLVKLLSSLPTWLKCLLLMASGVVVIGLPSLKLFRAVEWLRLSCKKTSP